MRPAVGIVHGPSLYRHECRKCAEETLHNARGCTRCETSPWLEPIKIAGNARRALVHGMKAKGINAFTPQPSLRQIGGDFGASRECT